MSSVGRFAEMVETVDIDGMVALLTDDAWVTMPPLPHAYQGHDAITAFLRGSASRRGAPLRLVPTRANGQPAFGCYLCVSETEAARAYALFVLTLEGDQISAITRICCFWLDVWSPPGSVERCPPRTDWR